MKPQVCRCWGERNFCKDGTFDQILWLANGQWEVVKPQQDIIHIYTCIYVHELYALVMFYDQNQVKSKWLQSQHSHWQSPEWSWLPTSRATTTANSNSGWYWLILLECLVLDTIGILINTSWHPHALKTEMKNIYDLSQRQDVNAQGETIWLTASVLEAWSCTWRIPTKWTGWFRVIFRESTNIIIPGLLSLQNQHITRGVPLLKRRRGSYPNQSDSENRFMMKLAWMMQCSSRRYRGGA